MRKSLSKHQLADLLVLLGLLAITLWYLWDAVQASTQILNLILIAPVAVIITLLCAVEFIQQLRGRGREDPKLEPVTAIVPVVSLFVFYVITLPWLGFDVGTFLFVSLFLWLHGERRLAWVLGYSFCFASLIALFFSQMLPYPMPMLLLPTDY